MKNDVLYYPYATIRSTDALNRALLYFDKIYVINPWEVMTDRSSRSEPPEYWYRADNMQRLADKGIVNYISTSELVEKYGKSVANYAREDMEDKEFKRYCDDKGEPTWEIATVKIPQEFRKFLQEMLNIPDNVFERNVVELPFYVSEALMLNHTLSALNGTNLVPFTDKSIHDTILKRKLELKMNNPYHRRDLIDKDYVNKENPNTDMTALTVINETIPSPSLSGLDLDKILEFRDKHSESLGKFRDKMAALANEIHTNYWDDEFKNKVKQKARDEIIPAIDTIKESTEDEEIMSVQIVATAHPAGGAALGGLDSYFDNKKRGGSSINGLTYLFEIQQAFL
jgi:hypothetical protein